MCSFQTSTGTTLMHLVVEKMGATELQKVRPSSATLLSSGEFGCVSQKDRDRETFDLALY